MAYRPTGWAAHRDQYAVPVLFNPYTGQPRDVRDVQSDPQGILIVPPGKVEMLAAKPTVKQSLQVATSPAAQQTCNCRWEGEVQVQQCTLHQAHVDAIHEWAGRAKAAEAKLAAQPAVPDAFGTREGEHPQYIQGWNDCRAEMLKGMK